jgi:hypothetical protein
LLHWLLVAFMHIYDGYPKEIDRPIEFNLGGVSNWRQIDQITLVEILLSSFLGLENNDRRDLLWSSIV